MDFKFEEILKNIFPGLLLFAAGYFYCTGIVPFYNGNNPFPLEWKDFSEIILVGIPVIAFVIGYFNDILASWLEDFVLFRITKRPAYRLFRDTTKRITLINKDELFANLKKGCDGITAGKAIDISANDAKQLFQHAKILAEKGVSDVIKEKMDALYKAFNFSRNFFTAFIITTIIVIIKRDHITVNKWILFGSLAAIAFLLFRRWWERGLYYSRLILTTANSNSSLNIEELRQQNAANIAKMEAEKAALSAQLAKAEADSIKQIAADLKQIAEKISK